MSEQSYDNQTIEQIWQMAKNDLKSSLSPAIFNTWILPSPLTQIRIIDELKVVPSKGDHPHLYLILFLSTLVG